MNTLPEAIAKAIDAHEASIARTLIHGHLEATPPHEVASRAALESAILAAIAEASGANDLRSQLAAAIISKVAVEAREQGQSDG